MVSRKPRERVCAVCGAARPHRGGGAASGATRERARKMTEMNDKRLADLVRFYSIITTLESKIGGAKRLSDCSGRASWPQRGVYFFHEPGENRTDTGEGPRIVRVGTHALKLGSGNEAVDTPFAAQGSDSERRRQSPGLHFQADCRGVTDSSRRPQSCHMGRRKQCIP
jgi:hypothetical protein